MDIRGLTIFISDVRKTTSKETETQRVDLELAKIRKYFQNPRLRSYDRKKCVAKLLYIYMLGFDIEFGHIEAIKLLTSQIYSEKHMGYLACSILLHENHEMTTLITQQAKDDLTSHISSRQCLALTCIGNIGGREQAESLVDDVQNILTGHDTSALVRKKSALCLCRLYRQYPELLSPDTWSPKLVNLLGSRDLGIVTALCSLLLALVCDHPSAYSACVPKVVRLLVSLVINKHYLAKYLYYGIPAPWLQIKLLRLLQYYDVPSDTNILQNLTTVMNANIEKAQRVRTIEQRKSSNRFNALHAVFFETLNLAIHYDRDKMMLVEGANILLNYVEAQEANLRYLALDTLARLGYSQFREVVGVIRRKQASILRCLKASDIAIRRRALDVLYSMCSSDNADKIVGELLEYLPQSDFAIREELVLKIAILAEKYSSDLTWYVDVILTLSRESGDYVSDDVWYRVCQIVTNRQDEALQKYAAETIFHAVGSPASHEICGRLAAYILGEFGHLIADQEFATPLKQFKVLCYKFETGNVRTRVVLLNTFVKMYNLYPDEADLRAKILALFQKYRSSFSIELQQRSNEYFSLLQSEDDDLLESVCDEMPPFTARTSVVVKKLLERQQAVTDQRIRALKGQLEEVDESGGGGKGITLPADAESESEEESEEEGEEEGAVENLLEMDSVSPPPNAATGAAPGIMDIISGAADPTPVIAPKTTASPAQILTFFGEDASAGAVSVPVKSAASTLTVDADGVSFDQAVHDRANILIRNLQLHNLGVGIEDESVQVKLKQEYRQQRARLGLYYTNKSATKVDVDCSVTLIEEMQADFTDVTTVLPGATVAQYFKLVCLSPFSGVMKVSIVYTMPHRKVRFDIPLPVLPHKFVVPLPNTKDEFFQLWGSVTAEDGQIQTLFRAMGEGTNLHKVRELTKAGFNLAINDEASDQNSVVAAGTFHSQSGNHVMLARVQLNPARHAVRLTTRCTSRIVNEAIHNCLKEHVENL